MARSSGTFLVVDFTYNKAAERSNATYETRIVQIMSLTAQSR